MHKLPLLVTALLLSGPLSLFAQDPAAKLAEEAAAEFDALAPSLEKEAKALISEVHKHHQQEPPQVSFEFDTSTTTSKTFISPKNKPVSIDTEKEFDITAKHRIYAYRFNSIKHIKRTGLRAFPFEGEVIVDMSQTNRQATSTHVVPLPVPEGYRKPKENEISENQPVYLEEMIPQDPIYGGINQSSSRSFPLPSRPPLFYLVQELPKEIQVAGRRPSEVLPKHQTHDDNRNVHRDHSLFARQETMELGLGLET